MFKFTAKTTQINGYTLDADGAPVYATVFLRGAIKPEKVLIAARKKDPQFTSCEEPIYVTEKRQISFDELMRLSQPVNNGLDVVE